MVTVVEELERISGYGIRITSVENKAREKWVLATTCIDFDASASA